MVPTVARRNPIRTPTSDRRTFTKERIPTRRAGLLLAAALFFAGPGRASAQECSAINGGDPVRLPDGQSYLEGTLVGLGPEWARIDIGDSQRTVEFGRAQPLEVHCLQHEQGISHFLKRASLGALVGGVAGGVYRLVTRPDVPKETVCGWLGCRQVSDPEPDPTVTWRSGALVGVGLGLVWAIVTRESRDWVALSPTGPLGGTTLIVEPRPGFDGAWTLAVRIPTSR